MEILQPYANWGAQPDVHGRPTILGTPTRTEFYRAKETGILGDDAISPGAQFEFTRNGVVTGIMTKASVPRPQTFDLGIEVIKNGREYLCTDGFDPVRFSPCSIAACFDPWCKVWIPVDAGEIWKFNMQNGLKETEVDYSLIVRVERFLEKPQRIPDYLTETVFYQVSRQDMEPGSADSEGLEWDFLRDGIVTGLRADVESSVGAAALLSGVELDVLLEGQIHLSNAKQTISPFDCNELSPVTQPWFDLWYAVNMHDKWQTFARNESDSTQSFKFTAKSEEVRVPWQRW